MSNDKFILFTPYRLCKKNIPHNGVHSLSHKLIGDILYKCKNNWQNELVHVELNKARPTKAWFITADYHGLFLLV